ncbi:DUF1294 domain-containing protein [Testudinibacter sp. P27/CKL/0425]
MPNWLILGSYLAAINIAAYFLMFRDKQSAVRNRRRIAERLFFRLCFAGGFVGVGLAMKRFRHKTQHLSFKVVVMLSAILWLGVLPAIWLYWQRY